MPFQDQDLNVSHVPINYGQCKIIMKIIIYCILVYSLNKGNIV